MAADRDRWTLDDAERRALAMASARSVAGLGEAEAAAMLRLAGRGLVVLRFAREGCRSWYQLTYEGSLALRRADGGGHGRSS